MVKVSLIYHNSAKKNLGDKIAEAAEDLSFDPIPDLLTHHIAFRKRNSGRLVSKFLRSFV